MNATGCGAVLVQIEGMAAPGQFQQLPDALAALWSALRTLPLSTTQANAFEYFLTRPDSADRVRRFLARDGSLSLTFTLNGRPHAVLVRPAVVAARRPLTLLSRL